MDQVKVTNEYSNHAFAKEIEYLKSLDPDRLLAGFRENRGLLPKADKYSGWENTEIKGHTLGHYLTASSQAFINTEDEEIRSRLDYMIAELKLCQFDSGYISAFPETLFDNVENNKPAWVPWYTLHKIILGIIDVYKSTQNRVAYDLATKLGEWVFNRTSKWTPEIHARVLAVEYGGMNDCLYELYTISRDNRHLEAAHKFDELALFTPIRQGNDILQGKHANTTIPKFLGALNRYKVLGESEVFYLEACIQFWDMVVNHHSYITGGNSEWEHFGEPDILDGDRSHFTCETCNSYNMLKLTRELFKITRNVKYADFYENTLINSILSSQNPETGMTTYFQPMATGYFKVYGSPFEHFWCCTGTGMENFTKLNDSIYFHEDNRIFINQFIGSTLTWGEGLVKLTQTAAIPDMDTVQIVIQTLNNTDKKLAIHLRVPSWAAGKVEIALNDATINFTEQDNYVVLDRPWKDGDVIRMRIPMKVSYSGLPDRNSVVGFRYGPVVLSAGLGQANMEQSQTGVMVSVPTKSMLIKDFITVKGTSAANWVEQLENNVVRKKDKLAFVLRNTDEDENLVFTPHFQQHSERYGIYWNLVESDSDELQRHILQNKHNERLKDTTIDSLPIANDQYELEHNVGGEHTFVGTWDGYNYRGAEENGWFSYQLKVLPQADNYLSVVYFAGGRGTAYDIFADGEWLSSEMLAPERNKNFHDKRYLIPAERIKDKRKIEIKFVAKGKTNGIYDRLRTMKSFDNNANLKQLSFNCGTLSEDFRQDLTEYTLMIPGEHSSLMLSVTPENKNALIYVNDILVEDVLPRKVSKQNRMTTLKITVTAEDHSTKKEYQVTVSY
ncbi:hypothetical protein E2980_19710 [Cohnella luojiensis]|uniref:Uncharacterized protein n=2 Tax=Cohnella luojiensis TaxID=652876 RepID=A0A4Y8LPU0_9BACL|nr:hypothetical protein E2980_19710 [Cohnella luojiensis]